MPGNDDLISRNKTVQLIYDAYKSVNKMDIPDEKKLIAMTDILQTAIGISMPAERPALRLGRWTKRGKWLECDVFDEHNITEWQSAKCSVCGHYHTTPYLYSFSYYNFCPTCGADMRKRNE